MKYIIIISLLFSLSSCVFIRMDDSIDLGQGFRLIQDYPRTIIYLRSEENPGSGPNVVPPSVLDYSYNDQWIVAVNSDLDDQQKRYWIVNKNEDYKNVVPLDSVTFYKKLTKLGIELKLTDPY